jgi:hypothetical protein
MSGFRKLTAVALAAGLAAGCGKPGFAPVRGQLVHPDGSPAAELDGFQVVFEGAAADGKAYAAVGPIDAQGRFELTTADPGDGAPVGTCRVLVEPKMLDSEREAPYPIDRKYRSFDTSGLTAEVKPGANEVTLTVVPKGAAKKN